MLTKKDCHHIKKNPSLMLFHINENDTVNVGMWIREMQIQKENVCFILCYTQLMSNKFRIMTWIVINS